MADGRSGSTTGAPPATTAVVADPAALAADPLGALVGEHLGHWNEVYDHTYGDPAETAGWRSSDTGEPVDPRLIAAWADHAAALVLRSRPRVVLELGCGSGMLLRRLAPHVEACVGTDLSDAAVGRLTGDGGSAGTVRVVRAAAHEVDAAVVRTALDGRAPDCVLLNSVAQYFPSVGYLARVLLGAVALVAPGGTVVVGDVRHSGLHEEFAAWAGREARTDEELLLDPQVLAGIAAGAGRSVRVLLHAKTLADDYEMSRYRFDAVLHVDATPGPAAQERAWPGRDGVAALVDAVLAAGETVRTTAVPNRLLRPDEPDAVTGAELAGLLTGRDAVVVQDPARPDRIAVVAPAAAAALAPYDVFAAAPGTGRAHEPLAAFARSRLVTGARRAARRAGRPVAAVTAVLPTGAGHAARAVGAEAEAVDEAGRTAVGGGRTAVAHDALDRVPLAVGQLDAIALHAIARMLADGPPATAPRHGWIVRRWREVLAALPAPPRRRPGLDPAGPLLDRACTALGYPAAMAAFYREALTRLPELLADELSPQALLFPDGDLETSLGKDRDNVSNAYLHGAVGRVLAMAAASRAAPLRVVELGGGAGGGTGAALAGLGDAPADYLFSDVSRFFTDAAARRFGPRVRCALLDVDADLVAQGVPAGGADVVLAANVLHCARDVGAALRHITPLLAPGGLLVVAEATREHPIVLAAMPFLLSPRDGGPPPGATDARAGGSVFLDVPGWQTELAAAGLRTLYALPGPGVPLAAAGQHVLVATRWAG